jgi:hypothetical protein
MGHGCYEQYYEGALSGLVAAYLLALGLLALRLDGQQRTHCPIHSDCLPFFHLLVLTNLTSSLPSISGAEPLTVSQERAGFPPGHSAQPPSSRSGSSDSRLPRPQHHRSKQPHQTLASRSALVVNSRRELGFANGPLGPNLTSWLCPKCCCSTSIRVRAVHRRPGRCLVTPPPFHRATIHLPARVWACIVFGIWFRALLFSLP